MQAIWKYQLLPIQDDYTIAMPKGAQVLTVQDQYSGVFIWVLVDTEAEKETRTFLMRGTGHPADDVDAAKYVGTFQLRGGELVFHVFEQ